MPDRKFIKTLFIETVLFISLFALFSHMAVNFWERHVIQKELVKMKSSLYTLKGTVNNIGVAYDHLHDELKTLVVFADNPYPSERESFEQRRNPQRKTPKFLDSYMQSSFEYDEKDINVKPSIRSRSQQISSLFKILPKSCKNATTQKTPLLRNVNIQKCSHISAKSCKSRNKNVDKYVDLEFPIEDHVQTTLRSYGKDVGPKTTLSLKSTGATAKPEYPNHSPKVRPRYASRSGCSSRYHEKCAPH